MDVVASWLAALWSGVAVHLWQTALFLAGLALVGLALGRASARMLNLLYWAGMLKILLPLPLLGRLTQGILAASGGAPSTGDPGWVAVTVLMYPVALGPDSAGVSTAQPALWLGWTAIWLAGAGALLLRARSRSRLTALHPPGDAVRAVLARAGLSPDQVRVSPVTAGPHARGWRRPVVVLPEIVAQRLDADELVAALVHEREHLVRRDPLRYAGLAAIRALFWFYPPVWWLVRRIHETTELACDEAVARAGLPAAIYCRSLSRTLSLALTHGSAAARVGVLGHRVSFLRRRLERIRSGRRFEAMLHHRLTVAAVTLAAVAASLLPVAPVASLYAGDPALAGGAGLEGLAEPQLPVMLSFPDVPLGRLYEAISRATGVEFRLEPGLADRTVSVDVGKKPLDVALWHIGAVAGVSYRVVDPRTVEVHPVLLVGVDGVTQPKRLDEWYVKPEYPREARAARIGGAVVMQALIDRYGNVDGLTVLRVEPAGFEPFARSATEAVRQWRYLPATRNGQAVDVYFTVKVGFELR